MATLKLRFTGLCSFVPNRVGDEAKVIMVDAIRPHGPHGAAHDAVLLVPADRVVSGANLRKPDEEFYRDGFRIALFRLHGNDISLKGAKPHELRICNPGSKSGCPSIDGKEDGYFSWVASMSVVNVNNGDMEPDCLKANEVARAVSARVFLTEGVLTSFDFARDRDLAILKWQFKPLAGGNPAAQEQALSEEVQLEFGFQDATADILFTQGIHSGTPASGLPVRLSEKDGFVVAWVVNMPPDDFKRTNYKAAFSATRESVARSINSKAAVTRGIDHHFVHYYDLVKGGISLRVPHPIERCPTENPPSVANPKCPPIQFNPAD